MVAMKVEWADSAQAELRHIASHYLTVAGLRTARKITDKIFTRPRILAHNPRAGQTELFLEDVKVEFRRLVVGNYKLIYHITDEAVRIVDIWDCRRDPEIMRERLVVLTRKNNKQLNS